MQRHNIIIAFLTMVILFALACVFALHVFPWVLPKSLHAHQGEFSLLVLYLSFGGLWWGWQLIRQRHQKNKKEGRG